MAILIRFSGYLAATVIFLSWLINNTFVTALQDDTQTLDTTSSERADAANLSALADLEDGERALRKKVAALEARLNSKNDESDPDKEWVDSFSANSAKLSSSAEDLAALVKRIQPLKDAALEQSISESVTQTTKLGERVKEAATSYQENQTEESLQTLDSLGKEFDEVDTRLVAVYSKLDEYMTTQRDESASAASTAAFIAYLFYGLGVAFGGIGKWLESRKKSNTDALAAA